MTPYPQSFTPEVGKVYHNHGGGDFKCTHVFAYRRAAEMQNIRSGWTLVAHGIRQYTDGSIEWDYSTDGTFKTVDGGEVMHA